MSNTDRPPLGIVPEWMHKELRIKEINEAIDRHVAMKYTIPQVWADELKSLSEWLDAYRSKKKEKERIEVTVYNNAIADEKTMLVKFSSPIGSNRYNPQIQKAIEQILNDEQPKEGSWLYDYGKQYEQKLKENAQNLFNQKSEQKPSRDWEIVKVRNKYSRTEITHELEIYEGRKIINGQNYEYVLNCLEHKYTIEAVKRLSDGEVFSVGEEVNSTWKQQIIERFFIDDSGELVAEFATCRNPFSKITKLTPEQLIQKIHEQPIHLTHDYVTKERCNELRKLAFDAARMHDGNGCAMKYWGFEAYDKDCNIK